MIKRIFSSICNSAMFLYDIAYYGLFHLNEKSFAWIAYVFVGTWAVAGATFKTQEAYYYSGTPYITLKTIQNAHEASAMLLSLQIYSYAVLCCRLIKIFIKTLILKNRWTKTHIYNG